MRRLGVVLLVLLLSAGVWASPLRGRVILIDPGHGGPDVGARGPTGLTEAEVNLAVALQLRQMLEKAGAVVHMTREADRAVAQPYTNVTADLQARVNMAIRIQPEAILSIHQNAQPHDPSERSIEVYRPSWGTEGAKRLAALVFEELVRETGNPGKSLGPATFFFLRSLQEHTVVLAEAYYITNPESEERLRSSEGIINQARAFYQALERFFEE